MNKIGDTIRNGGMLYTITRVDFDHKDHTTYYLTRNFDGSKWYVRCPKVTRFSTLHRIPDSIHANLDRQDVMSNVDRLLRGTV